MFLTPMFRYFGGLVRKSRTAWAIYETYSYYKNKALYKISPKLAADVAYSHYFGKRIQWDAPRDLIEKISWLQFNTDTSLWTLCADKYKLREYISNLGLSELLPKVYAKWDNPEDISFDNLPEEFVLKTNNACDTVIIVHDKTSENLEGIKRRFKKWMTREYGYYAGQTHYLRIQPCIFAEELLHQDAEAEAISPKSLIDYKVWCFNGTPYYIWVATDRTSKDVRMSLYDTQWNPQPQYLTNSAHCIYSNVQIPKPTCFDQMMQYASILSKPFPEVRVDFYVIGGRPILGELTFTSGYGYFTQDFYNILGDKITLPTIETSK